MNGINIKGTILAIVVMLIADTISGGVLLLFLRNGESVHDLVRTTPFLVGSVILGTLSTALGGYIAARFAKIRPYANAVVIGIVGIFIGIFTIERYPLWFNLVGFITVLPAALLGAHIAASHVRQKMSKLQRLYIISSVFEACLLGVAFLGPSASLALPVIFIERWWFSVAPNPDEYLSMGRKWKRYLLGYGFFMAIFFVWLFFGTSSFARIISDKLLYILIAGPLIPVIIAHNTSMFKALSDNDAGCDS
jgi:hypothetical protein